MGEVVDLDDYRPHRVGHVKCRACKYRYVCVAPVDAPWATGLECPKCGAMAVVLEGELVRVPTEAGTPALYDSPAEVIPIARPPRGRT